MKECKDCGTVRPTEEFYGVQNECKECTKFRVKKRYYENPEKILAYERHRAKLPHRIRAVKEYSKTERGKERLAHGKKEWAKRNPEKRRAHIAVGNAIRDKRLIKKPCEHCGINENIQAHHDDYSKFLDVRWLCAKCHHRHHAALD